MNLFTRKREVGLFLALGMSLCFIEWGLAQSKSSYEDRLSQIGTKQADHNLGTLSGRDKNEMRQKELFDAYTYVPSNSEKKEGTVSESTKSENIKLTEKEFEGKYVEFRNEHKIPNYIGDDVAKKVLTKAKDDTMKTEVVKIVEAEKLLQDTFKAYHEEKVKMELEGSLLKTIGNQKEKKLDTFAKEMDERIDIVGEKTANILNSSIQKLSSSNLIETKDTGREVYMASGGRVFPKLSLEEDKDFLNVRSHVMERVQRELMTALSSAINEFYHVEQKETSKSEIDKKEQLLAFVRVEDKAEGRSESKIERIQAIQEWITAVGNRPDYLGKREGGSVKMTPERFNEMKQQLAQLLGSLSAEDRTLFQKQADTNRERLGEPTGIVNGAPCYEANCDDMGGSGLGQSQSMRSGQAGPYNSNYSVTGSQPVPQKGSAFYDSFQKQSQVNKANGMGDPNGMVNGAPCYDGCGNASNNSGGNTSMSRMMTNPSSNPYGISSEGSYEKSTTAYTGAGSTDPTFQHQADVNRAQMGEPRGMVNGAPCYDGCQ